MDTLSTADERLSQCPPALHCDVIVSALSSWDAFSDDRLAAPIGSSGYAMKHVLSLLNLDASVSKVLLYRIWSLLAGAIVVIFVPLYLSADLQGYYFTFVSIVTLQALFDLGLTQTIIQVSSHEFAHVDASLSPSLADVRIGKLSYIKSTMADWYRLMARLFIIVTSVIGTVYFSIFGAGFQLAWFGPLMLLIASTGLNLILSPRLAMVEGAGWTGQVAALRLVQSVLGHGLLVLSLMSGGRLWSIAAVPLAANICTIVWLRRAENPYRSLPAYTAQEHDHRPWRTEIMGLQWRVAVAWLGGYLATQVMVPAVFALRGAQEAGRIGLGLQIFGATQALGMSWISARLPLFGQLISHAHWEMLKVRFVRAALSAMAVSATVAIAVGAVLAGVRAVGLPLAERLPSAFVIGALIFTSVLGTAIYAMAAYMRAHKEEPLVLSSVVIGGLTLVGATAGASVSADAAIAAYVAVLVLVNLPWTVLIFRRYYRRDNGSGARDAG